MFLANVRLALCISFILLFCGLPVISIGQTETPDPSGTPPEKIVIGSKTFTESYLLAEIMALKLEADGFKVERRIGLGNTMICFEALKAGEIHVYPEYTGTLKEAILNKPMLEDAQLKSEVRGLNLDFLLPFGFNNTYAIAVTQQFAKTHQLEKISDLSGKEFRGAFTFDFLRRTDGFEGLKSEYGLKLKTIGMEHALVYPALRDGRVDLIEVFSTDPKIAIMNLKLLVDDRGYFPKYFAAPLVKNNLPKKALDSLRQLADKIDADNMRRLNSEVELDKKTYAEVAAGFLKDMKLAEVKLTASQKNRIDFGEIRALTLQHLWLTFIAISIAIIISIPTGIMLRRFPKTSQPIMVAAGLLQTIPSLALLFFMVPFFGVGTLPAIVALTAYSILPILRNTHAAFESIDAQLLEVARGMGLYPSQIMWKVEFPLAFPIILTGVRTATVITVGTATIAAFIGAGGLGTLIVQGLAKGDMLLIGVGAVASMLLAISIESAFELLDRLTNWQRRLHRSV